MCMVFTLMVRYRSLVSFRNVFVGWLVDLQSHVMRGTEYFSQKAQPSPGLPFFALLATIDDHCHYLMGRTARSWHFNSIVII